MIKFFRKIRQNMIQENRTSKYLLYAIGEIVLVVIGILIALQINNWNQSRIKSNKEKLILNELIMDLEEQAVLLEDYIAFESKFFEIGKEVLKHYSKNHSFTANDSIYSKINSLVVRRTFNPVNTTFQELISTGNIGILSEVSTKRKVIQYYHELERISMIISNNNLYIIDGIYQPEILKWTVFFLDEVDGELANMNQGIVDINSLMPLREISQKLISEERNTLHLFNLLEQRTSIAKFHKKLYQSIQLKSAELCEAINNQLDVYK